MAVTGIKSKSSACVPFFSPCKFTLTIMRSIYTFLRDIFYSIGSLFKGTSNVEIKIDKPNPLVQVERVSTPVSPESHDEKVEEISVPAVLPLSPALSQGQLMIHSIAQLIHREVGEIFAVLFSDLDQIRFWEIDHSTGSFRVVLAHPLKWWVPKESHEKTRYGALLMFDQEIVGRLDAATKTIHFNRGFSLKCEAWMAFFWKEVNPVFTTMSYHHSGKVGLTAGILMQYETEFKSVEKLMRTWGDVTNRR